MITFERNTFDLYLCLITRLFRATEGLRPVTACGVGMAWQRWAERQGLWGTGRYAAQNAWRFYPVGG
jgi:hypothetical protein